MKTVRLLKLPLILLILLNNQLLFSISTNKRNMSARSQIDRRIKTLPSADSKKINPQDRRPTGQKRINILQRPIAPMYVMSDKEIKDHNKKMNEKRLALQDEKLIKTIDSAIVVYKSPRDNRARKIALNTIKTQQQELKTSKFIKQAEEKIREAGIKI